MPTPIDLHQHPFLRHPLPPPPMLGWLLSACCQQPSLLQDAVDTGTREDDPFPFFEQITQMLLITPRVGRARQLHHPLAHLWADRVGGLPASIPVYQSRSALLPVRCQHAPYLACGQGQQGRCLLHRQVGTQEPIEDQ